MNRSFILFSALLIFAAQGVAETSQTKFVNEHRSFFTLFFPEHSDLDLSYRYQPGNESDEGPGKFDLQDMRIGFESPAAVSVKSYSRFGVEYEARVYDLEPVRNARTSAERDVFHKLGAVIGFGHFFSNDLLFTAAARPGIYSDFDDTMDTDDFKVYGDGMFVYRINPGTQLVAGVEYSERYDDEPVLPLAGVRLLSSDGKIHVSVTFPVEARLSYNLSPQAQLYTGVWAEGDEYNIDLGGESDRFAAHVEERRWGAGVNFWPSARIKLKAEAGTAFDEEFKLKTRDPGQFEGGIDPTYYLSLGAGLAF